MFITRRLQSIILKRKFSSRSTVESNIIQHLKQRTLIRTTGEDVADFLQGLITNDIRHLDSSPGSLYTMFLNVKGRVMFDSIIYKTNDKKTYFIECDSQVLEPLKKHLKMYRVRRKIDISDVNDEYDIYAMFNITNANNVKEHSMKQNVDGVIVPCDKLEDSLSDNTTSTKFYKDIMIFRDPRLVHLGSRIISAKNKNILKDIQDIFGNNANSAIGDQYRWFRYSLGVGEGIVDLPVGNCFPLECNCDYLHGISFHKGCYIGQELTARTHHTGVIRKRLMPLYFNQVVTKLPQDNTILHEKVNLGKLRGVQEDIGLGLLRISKVLEFGEIKIDSSIAKVYKPYWWPLEAPKERIAVQKNE